MILSVKNTNKTTDSPVKEHHTPINTMEVESSNSMSSNSSSLIILIFITIIIAAIIITYIALSFIHKRMKAEEEHELNMEKLYHKPDETLVEANKSDYEKTVNSTYINNSSSNITNIYHSTPRTEIVTPIYRRPFISHAPVPPPHHEHHEHYHEGPKPSPKRVSPPPAPSIGKSSSMTRPSTPSKRVTTSSVKKSSSSMKRPVTPARSSKPSGSTMRKPSTPTRRGR